MGNGARAGEWKSNPGDGRSWTSITSAKTQKEMKVGKMEMRDAMDKRIIYETEQINGRNSIA